MRFCGIYFEGSVCKREANGNEFFVVVFHVNRRVLTVFFVYGFHEVGGRRKFLIVVYRFVGRVVLIVVDNLFAGRKALLRYVDNLVVQRECRTEHKAVDVFVYNEYGGRGIYDFVFRYVIETLIVEFVEIDFGFFVRLVFARTVLFRGFYDELQGVHFLACRRFVSRVVCADVLEDCARGVDCRVRIVH